MANSEQPLNRSIKYRFKEMTMISIPIVIEQSFMVLMGIISSVMVASKGAVASSAVNIVDSLSVFIMALFSALTVGGTIVVGQYVGKKDHEKATEAAAQSVFLTLVISLTVFFILLIFRYPIIKAMLGNSDMALYQSTMDFFFIVNFSFPVMTMTQSCFAILRGTGDTRTPMFISLIMNIINVSCGYVLINGIDVHFWLFNFNTPSYGVKGAAMALLLCRSLGMILAIFCIIRFSKIISFKSLSVFKPNFAMQKVILNLGVPTSIESGLFNGGKLITQTFIISMGTAALLANLVGNAIIGFTNVPGSSLSTALMIIVSQRVGKGEKEDIQKTIHFATLYGMLAMGTLCLLSFPLVETIIRLYKADAEAAVYIRQLLYSGFLISPLLWSPSFMTPSGLRAVGDVRFTMVVAICSMWSFRIFSGYILGIVFRMGIFGVWIGMYIDWVVRALFFNWRVLSRKWMKFTDSVVKER